MGRTRNKIEKDIIYFIESLGLEVHTGTKALGHQGFFRRNRIDISKNIKEERVIPTLLHEFAHYIIYNIQPVCKDFNPIFQSDSTVIYDELIKVTNFVDNNSNFEKLESQRKNIKQKIEQYEHKIKQSYPNFKRSEKFKPFIKYSRFSDLRHLEKHDAVKVLGWFGFKTYSIINLENDFPDLPIEFVAYLKLKSCQRYLASVSRKINKMKKYYKEPTELFARFIEGLYIDKETTIQLAPETYTIFKDLLYKDYYKHLNQLFEIVNISI